MSASWRWRRSWTLCIVPSRAIRPVCVHALVSQKQAYATRCVFRGNDTCSTVSGSFFWSEAFASPAICKCRTQLLPEQTCTPDSLKPRFLVRRQTLRKQKPLRHTGQLHGTMAPQVVSCPVSLFARWEECICIWHASMLMNYSYTGVMHNLGRLSTIFWPSSPVFSPTQNPGDTFGGGKDPCAPNFQIGVKFWKFFQWRVVETWARMLLLRTETGPREMLKSVMLT